MPCKVIDRCNKDIMKIVRPMKHRNQATNLTIHGSSQATNLTRHRSGLSGDEHD